MAQYAFINEKLISAQSNTEHARDRFYPEHDLTERERERDTHTHLLFNLFDLSSLHVDLIFKLSDPLKINDKEPKS